MNDKLKEKGKIKSKEDNDQAKKKLLIKTLSSSKSKE
jgi:hypothetical protein